MDSITQAVLGASMGEATLGKKVGNKALLWGAIAGTIPDLDVFIGKTMDTVGELDFHRGPSHSIVFAVVMAPILGWLVHRLYRKKEEASWKAWSWLFFWGIFTHPLLDCFTTWGTQLFWPFSEYRVSIQSIFVVDPIYTVPFLICVGALMFFKRTNPIRQKLNWVGIGWSTLYLFFTVLNKLYINQVFEKALYNKGIAYLSYATRPTPLNNILWTATAETRDSFYIGFYSHLDKDKEVNFYAVEKNHRLLEPVKDKPKIQTLVFLTKGQYTLEPTDNGLIMNDLRFGQASVSSEDGGEFVFAYHIIFPEHSKDGKLKVEQKPNNFEGAGRMMSELWERVKGI